MKTQFLITPEMLSEAGKTGQEVTIDVLIKFIDDTETVVTLEKYDTPNVYEAELDGVILNNIDTKSFIYKVI